MYNIRSHTMLGTSHSWAVTMRSLLTEFMRDGHKLSLNSINGTLMLDKSLTNCIDVGYNNIDIDIAYTMPKFFSSRFMKESKIKMAIYNYETSILPNIWKDQYKYVDFVLPSSNFSKQIFVDAGWPEEKCIVVPHGIDASLFNNNIKFDLRNKKTFRFLNISINHYRKNIDLLIEAYYDAFTEDDDVCLVIKTNLKTKGLERFEVNVVDVLKKIQTQYISRGRKNLPVIEIIDERIENISYLYNACDVLVSATSAEGFGLPLLEGLASKKVVIAPKCSGQIDFLNDKNSILVDVKKIKADSRHQYSLISDGAYTYLPVKEDLSSAMIHAYKSYKNLIDLYTPSMVETVSFYTWKNASDMIIRLADENI